MIAAAPVVSIRADRSGASRTQVPLTIIYAVSTLGMIASLALVLWWAVLIRKLRGAK